MKNWKKLLSLLLALCTVLGTLLLVACNGGTTDETPGGDPAPAVKKNYAVTVLDQTGAPVPNATVHFYAGTTEKATATTNVAGIIMMELEVTAYTLVVDAPTGYNAEASYSLPADKTTTVITLTKGDTRPTYKVTVKDFSGEPVVGLRVQLCIEGGTCILGPLTDENGVAVVTVNDIATYYISFPNAEDFSELYLFEEKYYFEGDAKETTITVYPNNIPDGTEAKPFIFAGEPVTVEIPAGTTIYYKSFGVYSNIFTATGFANGVVVCNDQSNTADASGNLSFTMPSAPPTAAGNTPIVFSLQNPGSTPLTVTFHITTLPGTRNNPYVISDITSPLTVEVVANGPAVYYKWIATTAGTFTVTCADASNSITLNNLTTSVYGAASNGLTTISVQVHVGDELQLLVNTILGEDGNSPAANLVLEFTVTP